MCAKEACMQTTNFLKPAVSCRRGRTDTFVLHASSTYKACSEDEKHTTEDLAYSPPATCMAKETNEAHVAHNFVCSSPAPLGSKGGTLGAGAACSNTGRVIVITQPSSAPDRICFKPQITRVPFGCRCQEHCSALDGIPACACSL